MAERVRLSDVSAQATAALVALDPAALERLAARLEQVVQSQSTGLPTVELETVEAVATSQRVLQDVLAATALNIQLLQRLQDRKVKAEWGR